MVKSKVYCQNTSQISKERNSRGSETPRVVCVFVNRNIQSHQAWWSLVSPGQLCPHWRHRRLSWRQSTVSAVMTKLASVFGGYMIEINFTRRGLMLVRHVDNSFHATCHDTTTCGFQSKSSIKQDYSKVGTHVRGLLYCMRISTIIGRNFYTSI